MATALRILVPVKRVIDYAVRDDSWYFLFLFLLFLSFLFERRGMDGSLKSLPDGVEGGGSKKIKKN
jgi:hypothetical protein